MADIGNTSVFSQTDASNGSGTMPSWLGSAAPSTLDDAGRALQGAVTREWNWRNYTLTSGGTGTALTLTYSVAPAAYYNGQRFAFITNTAVTGSCTLNVNSLGATTIKKVYGGTLTNLASGDIPAATFVEVAYNTANTCFVWVNSMAPFVTDASGNAILASETLGFGSNTNVSIRTASASNVMGVYTNNTERLRLTSTGDILNLSTGGLGYGSGSGGSVTQATSRTTGVTLNKTNGAITMFTAAGDVSAASFTVTNSTVAATDTIILNQKSGTNKYVLLVTTVASGSFQITFYTTGGAASDGPVINFSVIKAVTS